MGVQVNGKIRGEIETPQDMPKGDSVAAAKNLASVKPYIDGKTIVKEICVPGKIVNIVVK